MADIKYNVKTATDNNTIVAEGSFRDRRYKINELNKKNKK